MATALPHVVIVGAGFAGISAAKKLGESGVSAVRVTVIDRSNHHLFQPLLYQVATAGLSPADIAVPIRSVLRKQENTEILMAEVTGVDLEGRKVWFGEHSIQYDMLILATGARHSYFGNDSWEEFAPGLKSIADATRIRQKILLALEAAEMESEPAARRALLRFVIVGGGPTGVEMAGSIAELTRFAMASDFRHIHPSEVEVILIEAGDRVLRGFPENLSRKAERTLKHMGVTIRTGVRVQSIDAGGVSYAGNRIEAKTVIWAAGVVASPVGRWIGAETDRAGRVKVTPELTLPGHPEVFVLGDTAYKEQDGDQLPGVAPVAMQQGRYAARVIRARLAGKPIKPFRYINKGNLATVGRSFAIADFGRIRLSGFIAWVTWLVVHIYYLIGFRNRVLVMIQWAWAYLTFQRGARLITVDDTPLDQVQTRRK